MRRAGASYADIMSVLGLSKSTVRYMVREVELTAEQTAVLASRVPATAGRVNPAACRRGGQKGGRLAWTTHRKKTLAAVRQNIRRAAMAYTKAELLVKERLEALFERVFQKERIGERVIDFACTDLLVEHSTDGGKGIGDMIDRFESIASDARKKIAYVDTTKLGNRRRARLESLVDEVRDIRALA